MNTQYLNSEFAANLVALRTIVHREVRRFVRIWPQTLLPPAITMVLYHRSSRGAPFRAHLAADPHHHGSVLRHLR
jgi:hypothetical protein